MLFEALISQAQLQPQELAVIDDRGQHTYAQLAGTAAAMAKFIPSQTRQPRVGLLLPPGAAFVSSFYGTLLAGKSVVPLNYLLAEKEIAHCIRDSAIDTILTAPPLAARVQTLAQQLALNVIDLTQLPQPSPEASLTPSPSPLPAPAADDLAVLMYTSGTSGLPKGVLLTYRNIQSNADGAIAHAGFERRHRFLGMLPLFHAFGMVAMMVCPVQLGATVVYLGRFSPVGAMNAIREHGISLVLGVPSMYAAILRLKDAPAEDFRNIYATFCGGEPLPAALREGFAARFGLPLLEAYGMTETSLAITLNTPRSNKPGSVGTPIPGIQLKIADDNGAAVTGDAEGEVWVKGPMVMKGYNNLPEETAAAFSPDGYFKTGDLGRRDADGFLFITGRKKDLIIVAGEKAAPREIEDVLAPHPAVAEAAVVGKKDPSRGEVAVAFVIARQAAEGQPPIQPPKPEELREFCRQQGLAQWKVPREIYLVPDLPRSPTGKVLKRMLVQEAAGPGTG